MNAPLARLTQSIFRRERPLVVKAKMPVARTATAGRDQQIAHAQTADANRRSGTLALRPCWPFSRTRRMTMQDNEASVAPLTQARPLEQRQAGRRQAAAAAETCLVDPHEAPDRRPQARPGDVQSGNRQQATRLRCRRPQGGGHCAARMRRRARNGAPEKDRCAGAVRGDHPAGGR
jgi:hypothetical protein